MDSSQVQPQSATPPEQHSSHNALWMQVAAIAAGVFLAIVVSLSGGPAALWGKTAGTVSKPRSSQNSSTDAELTRSLDRESLDREKPQKQAELLLERAVSGGEGNQFAEQIQSRLTSWQGKLQWDSQLSNLTTVALNSSDESVRESAVEIQVAAYGLAKNSATVEALAREANSRDHGQRVWALWALGLLGNRGVESERVVNVLTAHLNVSGKNPSGIDDEDTRRWAVEGLALVGTSPTIAHLLNVLHNDSSPLVRERAACSLAQSGMLTHEQRLAAVPQLVNYSEDAALDGQTRAWVFQALTEITGQRLPNDAAAWREWEAGAGGQGLGSGISER